MTPSDSLRQANTDDTLLVPGLDDYSHLLIAADASDHSNHGLQAALAIGALSNAQITGAHVYAARLHDQRFRQMEGGLPEQYQEEEELERQRDIHDELITRGLSVITDSYLDQLQTSCERANLPYVRCALEGKNYRELVREANSGRHDLLVLGAQGLGAVAGGGLGTVCERSVRRSAIDTLVIKDAQRPISSGPLLVALDGSSRAYGALITAIRLCTAWAQPLHIVSAYDPYYHYVAFNRIAAVLSEEAGKVFRFKEQEKLHEDIIDAGLAKIYQGHLDVAADICREQGIEATTTLLAGKPWEVILRHAQTLDPALLLIGKLGIHADEELDIGGNAENLLRSATCSLLLSQREYRPRIEWIAEATTSWSTQAEERLLSVPSFARSMARLAILRFAQEQGHTVITESIVAEATAKLCPVMHDEPEAFDSGATDNKPHQKSPAEPPFNPLWSDEALARLQQIPSTSLRDTIRLRAEKHTRQAGAQEVRLQDVAAFVQLAELADINAINSTGDTAGKCPFGMKKSEAAPSQSIPWTADAEQRLQRVPAGFMRQMTRQRVEAHALKLKQGEVTLALMEDKYDQWEQDSQGQQMSLPWDEAAERRIARIPDFVRGMVIKEVERCAREKGLERVNLEVMKEANSGWLDSGGFHSEHNPDQYQ
ncbi:universal stress protein [Aestuariirhabdus sp. LZHN29]|uniref:universal stress protein n=1 Tax=Aestuariirhabdus sp. LZHN29 TaxID=3417462 RepID=UPI003CF0D464